MLKTQGCLTGEESEGSLPAMAETEEEAAAVAAVASVCVQQTLFMYA